MLVSCSVIYLPPDHNGKNPKHSSYLTMHEEYEFCSIWLYVPRETLLSCFSALFIGANKVDFRIFLGVPIITAALS